jgi:ribosomal protein S18 acetylase RimI-like enzyme
MKSLLSLRIAASLYLSHMKLTIREANTEDAALVADLSRQTFYDTFAAQNLPEDMELFMNEQFTRQSLMEEVGTPDHTFLLVYADDDVAGYACLRMGVAVPLLGTEKAIELARLYAVTSMIGKGVGKALMEASVNLARERGNEFIYLGVWEKNSRAITFYQQCGFEKFSEHDFMLGRDKQRDWLMKKKL